MTTTPEMPELPEPELGYIETDKSRQPAFSARQMRVAMQAQPAAESPCACWPGRMCSRSAQCAREAQPAAVSDVEIDRICYLATEIRFAKTDDAAQAVINKIRAILALRPQAGSGLIRGQIIAMISPDSNNSAEHDIAFAERVIAALRPQAVPMTDADVPEHVAMLDARDAFEAEATGSFGFKRSARGTYANPAVARDWKWFQLGARHARKGVA